MKLGKLEVYGVIYKITNTINNKVYIGQTTQNKGFDRRYKHNLKEYTHNTHLKNSIEKYGIKNFSISKVFDVAFSKTELDIKEKLWIGYYNSTNEEYGYNKTQGGNEFEFTEEIKKKISKISVLNWEKQEFRDKVVPKIREVTSSEDYKKNMSNSLKNSQKHKEACSSEEFRSTQKKLKKELWQNENYRKKVVEGVNKSWDKNRRESASEKMIKRHSNSEYKEKMSNAFKNRWKDEAQREALCNSMKKEYIAINLDTKEEITFLGVQALADYMGLSYSYTKTLIRKGRTYKNYKLIKKQNYSKEVV